MCIGVSGRHGGCEVRQIHFGCQTCHIVFGIQRVNVLAQIAQSHALILGLLLAKLRHDAPHGLVAVVVVLELLQSSQQRIPTPFGNANGEHDEETVQAGFFHHHAMFCQKLGQHGSRNTCFVKLAIQVQAGRDKRGLDGVEHVEAVGHLTKPVPLAALLFRVTAQNPIFGTTDAFIDQILRSPNLEPPVLAVFVIHFSHGAAKVKGLSNTFFHQGCATGRLHHGRRNIATGNDAVLRAGAGVHQIRFVEQVTVELGVL